MVLVLVKLPKGEMFISTNELHLSLVIESLFDILINLQILDL